MNARAPRHPFTCHRVPQFWRIPQPNSRWTTDTMEQRTYLVLRLSTTRSTVISSSNTKSPMSTPSWLAISLSLTRSFSSLLLRTARTRRSQITNRTYDRPTRATDPRALTVSSYARFTGGQLRYLERAANAVIFGPPRFPRPLPRMLIGR